ncbi:Alpha-ketoglutarate dehydrogenase component 4 [Lemmus lemmus]
MGSKMASASGVMQVVKPHAPLIRFPDRRDNLKLIASDILRSAGVPSYSSVISQHSKGNTAEILKTLPQKYRREIYLSRRNGLYPAWRSRMIAGCCLSPDKRIIFTIKDFQNVK